MTAGAEAGAAIGVVRAFLAALEARDVAVAQSYLAPDVRIVVPGGRIVGAAADIVANSRRRYRSIGKRIERFDAVAVAGGAQVVYCTGTLHGVWADGMAFEGVRFVDRFEVVAGCIRLQEVWNDAAEHRAMRVADASGSRSP